VARGDKTYDFVVIGAGAAGEAAGHEARRLGATVAVVERELVGGSCPFWACMPSKALLHAAGIHSVGGDYSWRHASNFRDWVISREKRRTSDDSGHVDRLAKAGADVVRGTATVVGPGSVRVKPKRGPAVALHGRNLIVAVGTHSTMPDLPGLAEAKPWTNRQATSTRRLPRSLVVLGGGPTGVELAQAFARYGVPVTIVHPEDRLNHRDHPSNSAVLRRALERDGVKLRFGVRATSVRPAVRAGVRHFVVLSDDSEVAGHELLLAIGRTAPLEGLGLETLGVKLEKGRVKPDDHLRIAENTFVVGDPGGPEMHTHLAHYEGEMVVQIALGLGVRPDFSAIPRATYTDPETAGVGVLLEEASKNGNDAFEETADVEPSAKGNVSESYGHATVVVDRREKRLLGAFLAGPGASEAIHECVLAVKTKTPIGVLADTIHAFPTLARVMGSVFVAAARRLEGNR
jgi:pyruvate/2-oxoglutarate dehydrogenase complex dihydrolipoamide dehydrogenase (E3) component